MPYWISAFSCICWIFVSEVYPLISFILTFPHGPPHPSVGSTYLLPCSHPLLHTNYCWWIFLCSDSSTFLFFSFILMVSEAIFLKHIFLFLICSHSYCLLPFRNVYEYGYMCAYFSVGASRIICTWTKGAFWSSFILNRCIYSKFSLGIQMYCSEIHAVVLLGFHMRYEWVLKSRLKT